MTYEPFKCPDCSVWWRGETHKCEDAPKKASLALHQHGPKEQGWISCPKCKKPISKYDWHTCKSYDKLHEQIYKKGNHHGPEELPPTRGNA